MPNRSMQSKLERSTKKHLSTQNLNPLLSNCFDATNWQDAIPKINHRFKTQSILDKRPCLQSRIVRHYQLLAANQRSLPSDTGGLVAGIIQIQKGEHTRCVQIDQLTIHRSDRRRGSQPNPSVRSGIYQRAP